MTDAALLARVGQFLYGPKWKIPLGKVIGRSDRTIRRWIAGKTAPPAEVRDSLRDLLMAHRQEFEAIEDLIDGEEPEAA